MLNSLPALTNWHRTFAILAFAILASLFSTAFITVDVSAGKLAYGDVIGHLTWQGRPQPSNSNTSVVATLILCNGTTQVYSGQFTTGLDGNFTVPTNLSMPGPYSYKIKGSNYLATGGSLTLPMPASPPQEFGPQRAGDCNGDNVVSLADYTILKQAFGCASPSACYNLQADFNGDGVINLPDYTLLKNNFGVPGVPLTCP